MYADKFKIALLGNLYQEKKWSLVGELLDVFRRLDAEVVIPQAFYDFITHRLGLSLEGCTLVPDTAELIADVAVCMGGDGTFLDVASRVGHKQIPLLGINTGHLGFLANYVPGEVEDALREVMNGHSHIEERTVITLSATGTTLQGCTSALNEIAILKHDISAMINIHTFVNHEYLTTYRADGLIIATPTGSSAYSLSVGGPIIEPHLSALTLTPVAPHSLNMRPLVVTDTSTIDLEVESRSGSFLVSLDGRSQSYKTGISLHIQKAPYTLKLLTHPDHTFFSTLRQKMMWGLDGRENL